MPNSPSFLDQCVGVREWTEARGKSVPWGYKVIEAGLPVLRIPGMKTLIHPPTADAWLQARVASKRKPKSIARKIARESAEATA